jgi:hypothetical protein
MTDIKKIFNDITLSTRTQLMIGGSLNSGDSIISKNISNITLNTIKNKMIEYNSFKKEYFNNGNIDKKYINALESVMYDILPLNCIIFENNDKLIDKIEKIYSLDNDNLFILFVEYFKLNTIKTISHEVIFFEYKGLLEKIMSIFINLRKSLSDDNDIQKLEKKWKYHDEIHGINTSSVYLYFIFNKIDKLPKYKWIIDKKEGDEKEKEKRKRVNNKIHIFLNKLDDIKYDYTGFCYYEIKQRMSSIFSFPIKELLDCIIEMDVENKYNNIHSYFDNLIEYINENKEYIKSKSNVYKIINNFNLKKVKLIEINRADEKNLIDTYINIIKFIFDSYVKFTPYLTCLENKFYKVSNKINKVSNKINKTGGYIYDNNTS